MRRRGLVLGGLALFAVAACGSAAGPAPSTQPAPPGTPTRFAVQARRVDGAFAEVGRLALRPDGSGDLAVSVSGSEAERLRSAWAEVSRRPVLTTKQRDASGMLAGREVPRGDPAYPAAVADVMSREFGYFLSPLD